MTMPDASVADNVRRLREMSERFGVPDVDAAPGAKKHHKPHAHVVEALGGAGAAAVACGHGHAHGDHSGVRTSKISCRFMKVRRRLLLQLQCIARVPLSHHCIRTYSCCCFARHASDDRCAQFIDTSPAGCFHFVAGAPR